MEPSFCSAYGIGTTHERGFTHRKDNRALTFVCTRQYHAVMTLLCRRSDSSLGGRYVLWLVLILAIGAYALWGAMDLLVRGTGIDWPI